MQTCVCSTGHQQPRLTRANTRCGYLLSPKTSLPCTLKRMKSHSDTVNVHRRTSTCLITHWKRQTTRLNPIFPGCASHDVRRRMQYKRGHRAYERLAERQRHTIKLCNLGVQRWSTYATVRVYMNVENGPWLSERRWFCSSNDRDISHLGNSGY
jgi:hypothetical protein